MNTVQPDDLTAEHAITAMLRIRNEGEFLEASVRSISALVDKIVLVDNLSEDRTPVIIQRLLEDYPDIAEAYYYPHAVARVGTDHRALSEDPGAQNSPRLLSNYYNWCLEKCKTPFVLKWDGDMIALPALAEQIASWRVSLRPILVMNGANVHSDRHHLIQAKVEDRETLEARLESPGLPSWARTLTYDHPEPRLFPRKDASYESSLGWVERLSSPFATRELKNTHRFRASEPCFLHMKFCKADPWVGYSPDMASVIDANITKGPVMPNAWRQVLSEHGHG